MSPPSACLATPDPCRPDRNSAVAYRARTLLDRTVPSLTLPFPGTPERT